MITAHEAEQQTEHFDVVVIGCGPGGAVLATYLARAGLSVLALEKEQFPRYHIGESLTGMAAEIIHDLDLTEEMNQRQFPPKGGVKVIGKDAKSEFFVPVLRDTWQVRRDEFDKILLDTAIKHDVTHRYGTVKGILRDGDKVTGVSYLPADSSEKTLKQIHCRFVADASGSSALFSKLGVAGSRTYFDDFNQQVALFTQFKDPIRDPGEMGNNTFIFYSEVHQWSWFIPVSPDVVSVGVVMPISKLKECGGKNEALQWGLENLNPDLRRRVQNCEALEPVRTVSNYSYCVEPFVGDGWLCVGDAHRFIDPIFSFGVSFAMVEAREASRAILKALETGDCTEPFAQYVKFSNTGQDVALDLIRYFWNYPIFFGYQTRGKLRKDIIRLLSAQCYQPDGNKALQMMRKALENEQYQPLRF